MIFPSCRAGQPSFPSGALPVLELKSGLFLRSSPPARGPAVFCEKRERRSSRLAGCRQPSFPREALPVLELKSGLFLRSSPTGPRTGGIHPEKTGAFLGCWPTTALPRNVDEDGGTNSPPSWSLLRGFFLEAPHRPADRRFSARNGNDDLPVLPGVANRRFPAGPCRFRS